MNVTLPKCCLQAKCEWGLTAVQESGLNSVVFAGMCVGAPVWGMVSDVYGRKVSFCLATTISAIFGFASAAAPNFEVSACQQLPGMDSVQQMSTATHQPRMGQPASQPASPSSA
jgi:MFS family permease